MTAETAQSDTWRHFFMEKNTSANRARSQSLSVEILGDRESNRKYAALAFPVGFDPDFSALFFGDAFRHKEANAHAFGVGVAGVFTSIETFEYARGCFAGHADAGVGNFDDAVAAVGIDEGADFDRAARRRVVHGVFEEY